MTLSRWPVAFPAYVPRMTWPAARAGHLRKVDGRQALDRVGFYRRNRPSYTLLQF